MTRAFSPRRNRAALRALIRRLGRNRRGVAAVEFAMILPAMLAIYFGIVETGQAIMIDRKVTQLTRSLVDLSSQVSTIPTTEVGNIFDAAQTVMMPYTSVAPKMSIHHIVIDSAGVAKVCWSEQRNSTKLARGTTVALPADLRMPNTSIMMAQASYDFTPVVGWIIKGGAITIGGSPIYMRPRLGKAGGSASIEQVERSGVAMCPGFG
ncbi:TadE/TadG family type IV pilus assembly protein [Bosea sp. 124]|uniref:TadE/TadG family type IV pilus assembly protein n=1 Tax=Bosea sp. 124 TaxID=2135642 RepID=UPI000D44B504|nr:TadE/TadG family type IV pilus assembly protein [Bosea sp. 124]PTM40179.1 Flp pilus assembly protein TadG [Bosea sp. 124]